MDSSESLAKTIKSAKSIHVFKICLLFASPPPVPLPEPLQLSVWLLLLGCWPSGRLDTVVPSAYTRENHCVVRCVVITHHH